MNIYLARQPIFNRHLDVLGYELLYRDSLENKFSGIDDDIATKELINNAFLMMDLNEIVGEGFAFINFSKDMMSSEIPLMLPKKKIVIEILERGEITEELIESVKMLKGEGYTLALDDFICHGRNDELLSLVDIIKVDYPFVSHEDQKHLMDEFGKTTKFLAEKIETREDYHIAKNLGYDYFQGYFFSKPIMMSTKDVEVLDINVINILSELSKEEPDFGAISAIVAKDMGISYKLLRLANSVYYGATTRFKSVQQALIYIGIHELNQWFSIMLLRSIQNPENAEMIKVSMIRGKLMESLAEDCGCYDKIEYFFLGMFSAIDALLNKPMDVILESLPLSESVKGALTGDDNDYRQCLDGVIAFENADWDQASQMKPIDIIGGEKFMEYYLDALKWAEQLKY